MRIDYRKAVTFSFDDGVTQDKRLVELFNKYGLKATFNLNSELLSKLGELVGNGVRVRHDKVSPHEVKGIYEGHEVASHTLTHPLLPKIEDDAEIIRQVEKDRLNLSELVGYEVTGFAYPCGGLNYDERVARLIRENTGIKFARTIISSGNFDVARGDALYTLLPTVHHINIPELYTLADKFLASESDEPQLFYIWGHSYELDMKSVWTEFEDFLKFISGRNDIFYGTNGECLNTL